MLIVICRIQAPHDRDPECFFEIQLSKQVQPCFAPMTFGDVPDETRRRCTLSEERSQFADDFRTWVDCHLLRIPMKKAPYRLNSTRIVS